MAGKFGFIVHPPDWGDVASRSPLASWFRRRLAEAVRSRFPPRCLSHVGGVCSPWNEAEGWLVGVPLTGRQMLSLPEARVVAKVVAAGRLAERQGARIIGLGGLAALVGDGGRAVAARLEAGVTNGISYHVYATVESAKRGAAFLDIDLAEAEVAVVGATSPAGRACALLIAEECRNLTLVGGSEPGLEALAREVLRETGLSAQISTDLKKTASRADVIIAASDAMDAPVPPEDVKTGAVLCDVGWRRRAARTVAEARDDVLVIEGGVVDVPGNVNFGADFGQPPESCTAPMAETIVLALEERYEDYTLGRDCPPERVREIARLARKHGFRLSGLRGCGRVLTQEEMERIRANARERRGRPRSYPSLDNGKAG